MPTRGADSLAAARPFDDVAAEGPVMSRTTTVPPFKFTTIAAHTALTKPERQTQFVAATVAEGSRLWILRTSWAT